MPKLMANSCGEHKNNLFIPGVPSDLKKLACSGSPSAMHIIITREAEFLRNTWSLGPSPDKLYSAALVNAGVCRGVVSSGWAEALGVFESTPGDINMQL